MILLQIDAVNSYKPRPDFMFRVHVDGKVYYSGRFYVGVLGDKTVVIDNDKLEKIKLLLEFLVKRNQKNYLKKRIDPVYTVEVGAGFKTSFEVDEKDIVSEDIIGQIIDLSGVRNWVKASLDLYLVMSKPENRSKELAVLRASDEDNAIAMYLEDRKTQNYKTARDYWSFCIGFQKPDELFIPSIFFSYSDYQIQENAPMLLLNQGPELEPEAYNVYLFISFGKRFNDSNASYFLVLAKDADDARRVFKSSYPHFMPRDFQLVDTGLRYNPIPLFRTRIPIAIR